MDGMYRWHGANTNNDDENNQDVDSRSHIRSSIAQRVVNESSLNVTVRRGIPDNLVRSAGSQDNDPARCLTLLL